MACPLPGRGIGALGNLARSSQPRTADEDETAITVATLKPPPGDNALSSRLPTREPGISLASVVEA
jgi:hypothetical protein